LNYDEDEERWYLAPPDNLPPLRNRASKTEIRPTSDFEKAARLAEDPLNLGRYKCENIFLLSLDIPQRTTKDYQSPVISPSLQAALAEVMRSQSNSMEVQSSKYKPIDIHSFLKSACRRKMIQRPKSRNSKMNSPSHKRHPQCYVPDGTATPYPKSRGLVPK